MACSSPHPLQVAELAACRGVSQNKEPLWIQWTSLGESGAGMSDDSILAMRMQGQGLLSDGGGNGEQTSKYNSCPNPAPSAVPCEPNLTAVAHPPGPHSPTKAGVRADTALHTSNQPAPATGTTLGWVALVRRAGMCRSLLRPRALGLTATAKPRQPAHVSPPPTPTRPPAPPVLGRRPTRSGGSRG